MGRLGRGRRAARRPVPGPLPDPPRPGRPAAGRGQRERARRAPERATPALPSQFAEALQAGAAHTGYSAAGLQALLVAEKYIGTPYHWGGDTPATGFDCSGLVQYSYSQLGIHIPRVAADQFNVGIPVTKAELRPGDIVFFKDSTGYVHHEGIYIGNDMFLHAPHTGDVVKVSSLDTPYYAQQFAGGRDVTGLALERRAGFDRAAGEQRAGLDRAHAERRAACDARRTAPGRPDPRERERESGLFGAGSQNPGTGGSRGRAQPPSDPGTPAPLGPAARERQHGADLPGDQGPERVTPRRSAVAHLARAERRRGRSASPAVGPAPPGLQPHGREQTQPATFERRERGASPAAIVEASPAFSPSARP